MGIEYKIIFIFVYIIELLILLDYSERLFERKLSKAKTLLISGSLYMVLYIICVTSNINEVLNSVFFTVANLLILICCYHTRILYSIFHSVVITIIMLASENLSIYASSSIFKISTFSFKQDFISFSIIFVSSKFLYYIISRIFSGILKKDESVKGTHWLLFIMPLSSIVCSVLIHYLSSFVKNNEFIYVLCFASILLLFAANVIIFQVYSKSSKTAAELYELKAIEQKQEIDNTYMQIIEENNNDFKIFCHDIKNHLEQISKLSDNPKIKEYVNSLYGTVNEYSYTGMSDNKVLDIIISKYKSLCQNKSINISFDTKTANLDFMEDIDLANVMNNLLDNAVEAAEKSSEKRISVSVYSKNNTMQIIKITNSSDTAPKVSEQRLLTSKKNKTLHGLGLTSVKNTLKKYDAILDWNYDEENKSFETTIVFSI